MGLRFELYYYEDKERFDMTLNELDLMKKSTKEEILEKISQTIDLFYKGKKK
jgi:hypothetical protein